MTTLVAPNTKTVLDHGFVQLIESWGSDARIIEAARMSTAKGFTGWGEGDKTCEIKPASSRTCEKGTNACVVRHVGDEKLLRFLWEHKHATPFEMGGLTVEVQAPIFVFREWHRHRTQSYNEMSARYTPLPDVNYVPSLERVMMRGGANKQASGTGHELTTFHANAFILNLTKAYVEAEAQYQTALADGVPKELARCFLPVGRYSRMRASANLRNWLGFLALRMDPAAQWEIRQYAMAMASLVKPLFPRTYALFEEGLEHAQHP
jgi:thymidylate synthase (FAD)